jgi:hypothetical protein
MKKQPKHGGDLAAVSGDISLGALERVNHLISTKSVPTESSSISLVSFSSARMNNLTKTHKERKVLDLLVCIAK